MTSSYSLSSSHRNNNSFRSSSVLVDPPTTVHLDDADADDNDDADQSDRLIGDSILTMDDEYNRAGTYDDIRGKSRNGWSGPRTNPIGLESTPGNHFSFSPSTTDKYFAARNRTEERVELDSRSSIKNNDEKNCNSCSYRSDLHLRDDDGARERSRHDIHQLLSSFKKELDRVYFGVGAPLTDTSASERAPRCSGFRASSTSVAPTPPPPFPTSRTDTNRGTARKTTTTSSSNNSTTPSIYTAVPMTKQQYDNSSFTPIATMPTPIYGQGPEPYPTPPPPRPVDTPLIFKSDRINSGRFRPPESSIPMSSKVSSKATSASASETAPNQKYNSDYRSTATDVGSFRDNHGANSISNDQTLDQLKKTIRQQELELDLLRRENERLKASRRNRTPAEKLRRTLHDPSGNSGITGVVHDIGDENCGAALSRRENSHRGFDRRNEDQDHRQHDQTTSDKIFSPGTRYVAKLVRHMRLEDDHYVPLSEIIDRHWDKIANSNSTTSHVSLN